MDEQNNVAPAGEPMDAPEEEMKKVGEEMAGEGVELTPAE
jgi:hypothetical protein